MNTQSTLFESKIGMINVVSEADVLVRIDINPSFHVDSVDSKFNNFVIFELKSYFDGVLREFSVPFKLNDTSEFRLKVWGELQRIPYGVATSYGEIARKIGSKNAVRAVGTAIGKNPLPIIIPCHRVLNSNGCIGGFSAGIDVKRNLIKIEHMDGFKKNC